MSVLRRLMIVMAGFLLAVVQLGNARQHEFTGALGKIEQGLELVAAVAGKQSLHGLLHGRKQRADGGDLVLAHPHQHLAPVLRVGHALDQAQPLQPVDQAGDGATGEAGAARDVARRRRAVQQDEIEAFEVARVDADPARDRLAMQDAGRRRAAHRQHEAADQRLLAVLVGFAVGHVSLPPR